MRHNLYLFRCDQRMTQAQIAEKLGVSRQLYASIEKGRQRVSAEFWSTLQRVFEIPDADMYGLMRLDD